MLILLQIPVILLAILTVYIWYQAISHKMAERKERLEREKNRWARYRRVSDDAIYIGMD